MNSFGPQFDALKQLPAHIFTALIIGLVISFVIPIASHLYGSYVNQKADRVYKAAVGMNHKRH